MRKRISSNSAKLIGWGENGVISLLSTSNQTTTVGALDHRVDDLGHSIPITIVLSKLIDILLKPSCRDRPRLIETVKPVGLEIFGPASMVLGTKE